MSELVLRQRHALCDMLTSLEPEQWSAPTLCAGWDAGDVAAHLVVREREPWAAAGIMLPGPPARLTRRRCEAWKAQGPRRLIEALRAGPPWPLSGVLGSSQVTEDWIHEQDIRRGGAGLQTPPPDAELGEALWRGVVRVSTRTLAIRRDAVIELHDGIHRHRVRTRLRWPLALPTTAPADARITGPVGELLLYVTGRTGAQVTLEGDAAVLRALEAASRRL